MWGDGHEGGESAHYFSTIVEHLLPSSAEETVDAAIEAAKKALLTNMQDGNDAG
jgi:hypothetical protein